MTAGCRLSLLLGLSLCVSASLARAETVLVPTPPPVVHPAPSAPAEPVQAAPVEEPDAPDEMEEPKDMQPLPADVPETPPAASAHETPAAPETKGETGFTTVLLQGLNKVTARSETIEAPIGDVVRFGTIEIVAHSCWKAAPEERPENAALLEISEVKQGEAPQRIFLGWMFSSSPGLSGLENPFYDVTVLKCENKAKE